MGESAIFGLDLSQDPENSKTTQLVTISQPHLSFPPSFYNTESPLFWKVMNFYEKVHLAVGKSLFKYG